ncbi:MAG: hypothetical protein AABW88_01620 [Nanoarchaeota archaeon]
MLKKRGVHRPSSHYDPLHWKNLPPGIKVLIAYTGFITLLYLLYFLFAAKKPISVVFGVLLSGNIALVIELISLGLLFSILYGLVKREFWVFYISLAWFSFGILNAVISLIKFNSEFDILKKVLIASSFIIILLNGLIVWYVYSEKKYFKTKHLNKETKAKDKVFVYIISIFIIVSLLILITYCLEFYNTTLKTTKDIVSELKNADVPDIVCVQKSGNEQDICYLVLAIMNEEKGSQQCENINSDFYKMTCYRALQ